MAASACLSLCKVVLRHFSDVQYLWGALTMMVWQSNSYWLYMNPASSQSNCQANMIGIAGEVCTPSLVNPGPYQQARLESSRSSIMSLMTATV